MLNAKRLLRAIILLPLLMLASGASAQILRPARAVYDLKLDRSRESPGIDAVQGRLVVEYMESCAGYVFNQAFITNITSSDGPNLVGDMEASVWESRDGRAVRFNLLNRINGEVVEREQGRAELDAAGAGVATWRLPKPRELPLPKGTMFPISHNRAILRAAMAGSRGFEAQLFDGSNDAGYYNASVFIGKGAVGAQGEGNKLLPAEMTRWPIRLAYYHYDNRLGVPEFEVGFTLYSDGVVDDLQLDYPEFGLRGRLQELEYLDQPECD